MKARLLAAGLTAASPALAADGAALYAEHCLSCHQADGYGVPNFQPAIVESPWLTGDAETAAWFVLRGSAALSGRGPDSKYDNIMPGFAQLSDQELARLLSYVRATFGHAAAPAVEREDVAAARDRLADE